MEEATSYVIGFSLTIIGMIASTAYWLGRRFTKMEEQLKEVRKELPRAVDGFRSAVVSANSLILDPLALKKLIEEGEANLIKSEITRVISMVKLNPLRKEELEFLRKVVAKDVNEITMEEAERIAEIGKRWWYEDGCEEAYKVFLGGLVIRGYLISKMLKEGRKPWWMEPPSEVQV